MPFIGLSRSRRYIGGLQSGVRGVPLVVAGIFAVAGIGLMSYSRAQTTTSGQARFPGDPNPVVTQQAYLGSKYAGKASALTDPGAQASIHRSDFDVWPVPADLYSAVADDHANGRLPLVTIKTPSAQMAIDGDYDSEIDAILQQLDATGKPVWLSADVEPETAASVGPDAWRTAQRLIRGRMQALKTKNIALVAILRSDTWDAASGRNPDDWWQTGVWDAFLVDHSQALSGNPLNGTWLQYAAWSKSKSVPFGAASWHVNGSDSQAADQFQAFWNWGFKNNQDAVAFVYDESTDQPLSGAVLQRFYGILKADQRVFRGDR